MYTADRQRWIIFPSPVLYVTKEPGWGYEPQSWGPSSVTLSQSKYCAGICTKHFYRQATQRETAHTWKFFQSLIYKLFKNMTITP